MTMTLEKSRTFVGGLFLTISFEVAFILGYAVALYQPFPFFIGGTLGILFGGLLMTIMSGDKK